MRNCIFAIVVFFSTAQLQADVILAWNTFGNAGTETTEASTVNIAGVSSANLTLGGGVTPAPNTNRFGGNAWFDAGDGTSPTLASALAGNDYIQFVVSPQAGFAMTLTNFDFDWDGSASGPGQLALLSSVGGFTDGAQIGTLAVVSGVLNGTGTDQSFALPGASFSNLTSAVTFRIYGFGNGGTNAGTTGSGGFDTNSAAANNVVLMGSIVAVPEPSAAVLTSLVGLAFLLRRSRFSNSCKAS